MTLWKRCGPENTGPRIKNYDLVIEILNGSTFEKAGKKREIKRNTAKELFNRTVVRNPFTIISHGYCTDIKVLRKRFNSLGKTKL